MLYSFGITTVSMNFFNLFPACRFKLQRLQSLSSLCTYGFSFPQQEHMPTPRFTRFWHCAQYSPLTLAGGLTFPHFVHSMVAGNVALLTQSGQMPDPSVRNRLNLPQTLQLALGSFLRHSPQIITQSSTVLRIW